VAARRSLSHSRVLFCQCHVVLRSPLSVGGSLPRYHTTTHPWFRVPFA
jgi:hypothetical protein